MTIVEPSPSVAEEVPRVDVALPPGAETLIGWDLVRPRGLVWAGGFSDPYAAVVALIRRALSIDEATP